MPSVSSSSTRSTKRSSPPMGPGGEPNSAARLRAPDDVHAAAGARYYAGRWDDAIAEMEAGLAVVEDTGSLNFVLYYEALSPIATVGATSRRRNRTCRPARSISRVASRCSAPIGFSAPRPVPGRRRADRRGRDRRRDGLGPDCVHPVLLRVPGSRPILVRRPSRPAAPSSPARSPTTWKRAPGEHPPPAGRRGTPLPRSDRTRSPASARSGQGSTATALGPSISLAAASQPPG